MIRPDTILMRYMPKYKFTSLLKNGLYLSKSTKFKDKLEGILPYFATDSDSQLLNREIIRNSLEWVYVSCWFNSSLESNTMWEQYGENDEAIAIQITASKLQSLYLGENRNMQSYFDYVIYKNPEIESFKKHIPITVLTHCLANEGFPELVYSTLFSFYKHSAFESENEVRLAVIDSNANKNKNNDKDGICLELKEPAKFLEKIIVSPYSSPKFKDEIQAILNAHNVCVQVNDSQMKLKN